MEAKNSKDVSNTEVKKKTISHKKKYSLNLVNSKDGHPVRSGKKLRIALRGQASEFSSILTKLLSIKKFNFYF